VLPDLQGQIDIMRRYLEDLYLVITARGLRGWRGSSPPAPILLRIRAGPC
jgi:hypothetical protein